MDRACRSAAGSGYGEHTDRHEDPHGGHERILETDLDTETDP